MHKNNAYTSDATLPAFVENLACLPRPCSTQLWSKPAGVSSMSLPMRLGSVKSKAVPLTGVIAPVGMPSSVVGM